MSHTFVDTLEDITAMSWLSCAPGGLDGYLVIPACSQLGRQAWLALTFIWSWTTFALLRSTLDRDRVRWALRCKYDVTFCLITVNNSQFWNQKNNYMYINFFINFWFAAFFFSNYWHLLQLCWWNSFLTFHQKNYWILKVKFINRLSLMQFWYFYPACRMIYTAHKSLQASQ